MGNRKPLVVYHKNCVDGFSAAWCFWDRFKDTVEYFPGSYNVGELPDFSGRIVYMVDFSYPADLTMSIIDEAKYVCVIDHHKTAFERLSNIIHANFKLIYDVDKSGAMLAWEFLNGRMEPPELLKYVQDRDLWTKKLPNCDAVAMALFAHTYDFEKYEYLMKECPINTLIMEGWAILRKFEKDLEELLGQVVRMMDIGGHVVPVANLPYMYASEGATRLAKGFPFAATYYDTDTNRVFSLRSTPEGMDVSQIASAYGGGGHRNASGFKVPRNHVLASV